MTSVLGSQVIPVPVSKPINAHTEWGELQEVIVGTAKSARTPKDLGIEATSSRGLYVGGDPDPFPDQVIEETEEDLDKFVGDLKKLGICVRQPRAIDTSSHIQTPYWDSGVYFPYSARDILLSVGDMIIETPGVWRSRLLEAWAYKDILLDYFKKGGRWMSAPRPALPDDTFDFEDSAVSVLRNLEPVFDAANVLKAGRDIFYLVSDSGNELGLQWLQSVLGPQYRVHACHNLYHSLHIDTTIALLRPGLVLANPERVNEQNIPGPLKSWDVVYAPEMVPYSYSDLPNAPSKWIGMNVLMLSETLAVVDMHQKPLIKVLEGKGIDVLPLRLRHGRALGGGAHCTTLDVRRKEDLESYF